MKEYFKYNRGYVNINDENLFLTNSGNWHETLELLEKSPKSIKSNYFKSFKTYLFFLLLFIACGFIFYGKEHTTKSRAIPIGVIFLIIAAYQYLKRESGNSYKIPISKIQRITLIEERVTIEFLNLDGISDSETINGIEEKGKAILSDLIQLIKAEKG